MPALEQQVTVLNAYGIHARPAAMFVKVAGRYTSDIKVERDGMQVSGKSIMGLLTLGSEQGTELVLLADGEDAAEAIEALVDLFTRKFDEEE